MDTFLAALGNEIEDVDEETFDLFSHAQLSQDLGMIDPKAEELAIPIAGRDFTIKQSPGVLQSKRETGTTGATLWRACIHFSEWFGSASNPLFKHGVIDSESAVLELGSGISGLVPSVLSSSVGRFTATDQQYAIRLLQENINANTPRTTKTTTSRNRSKSSSQTTSIEVLALDWELDDINSFLRVNGLEAGVDVVLASDCIFNFALIKPLVQTCTDICEARPSLGQTKESASTPTLCVVVQQLRQPDVFREWLEEFMSPFRVWRIPDNLLTRALKEGSGFVLHVGLLRSAGSRAEQAST